MNRKVAVFIIACGIFFYVMLYCCIYTAVIMFEVLKPFDSEYRCKDMSGTDHFHAYVHVGEYDLFLNPFRAYDNGYGVYKSTDAFVQACPNWGYLYVPTLDTFVNKNGVVE